MPVCHPICKLTAANPTAEHSTTNANHSLQLLVMWMNLTNLLSQTSQIFKRCLLDRDGTTVVECLAGVYEALDFMPSNTHMCTNVFKSIF